MHGSFNLCVPVTVEEFGRVIIRFPLPYRVGDSFHPGNSDEKVKCEAGTYAWLQQEFYDSRTGTDVYSPFPPPPLLVLNFHGPPGTIAVVRRDSGIGKEIGAYLIIDYIEEGEMLSVTWADQNTRKDLRNNLFRGLARVMLILNRVSLPRIGSFIIDDCGFLSLANRPLTLMLHDLENENIPVDMPTDETFASVYSYVNRLFTCHDNRLRSQPNAVNSGSDCVSQMTALALMRTVRPQFFDRGLNHGPFVFCLTDLHASNILVDKDWNIKCLIDLEWATSLPIESMRTPIWLTSQAVDEINTEDYNELRQEFMAIFEEEERACPAEYPYRRACIMNNGWNSERSEKHAKDPKFYLMISHYWGRGAAEFIKSKLDDKRAYDERLREVFEGS
ncbi:hypothetical protein CNMCM6106_004297 [Aspergillus hiratsukae]|uniref:Aminoglycoside phosphotransferase domain-containing protein n=1 Tax=Aspergillus hiratsukae TaxID=1194566 RepID=A0A8H6UKA7_9EURO|nr:hypothetical protein CNMCM6106_004297 [Aspergillus hiratsukae]